METVAAGLEAAPQNMVPLPRAIFILGHASLKKGYVGKKRKILDADEDADFLKRQKQNPDNYRPEIVFQAVKLILDIPLNKNGRVGAIYVKTDEGLLCQIKPLVRIPRTRNRFCGIILELLEKKCVRATSEPDEKLFETLEGPVTRYLPPNFRIVGLSYNADKFVDVRDYVSAVADDVNLAFVMDTTVNGKVNKAETDDYISSKFDPKLRNVANYPLSAKYCMGMVCMAFEKKWKL
ncbi:ribosomal RNA small subunit methyltransferase NEP1-like [Durio zibethinus]|uniref:Ribosomal RNA small subunit methyltransferase NEP1-like n=1 Tax=Durio zibethinus TaxID=66656 RepID=A0A6P6ALV5_DURZI|nr:ribosomal RNA small subunit methyltransferase NEP1-like [Durio zibethinus]